MGRIASGGNMDTAVIDQVRAFVVANFLFGDTARMPGDAESLLAAGVVDSTGVLELVEFLEDDLGVPVADHETVPANLDSIENLARFVERKRADSR
ncbi:acyl carrier protein [Pseudactinotalea sp. HY160]|uniref:acyl carrier protein n=1 Tax=Pseudactinotalea sp. HY160 TaxID=2654490 RepID=UPI001D1344CC|nr:acyl carrier protein [Pseudactinotalea sp. HY160]